MHIDAIEKVQFSDLNKKIIDFQQNHFYSKKQIKIIILENFEYLGNLGQMGMRERLQKRDINSKFWIITRFFSKINQPILSRCVDIHFNLPHPFLMLIRMVEIFNKDNVFTSLESLQYSLGISKRNLEYSLKITPYIPYYVENYFDENVYFYCHKLINILGLDNLTKESKLVFHKKLNFYKPSDLNLKEQLHENHKGQFYQLLSLIFF